MYVLLRILLPANTAAAVYVFLHKGNHHVFQG